MGSLDAVGIRSAVAVSGRGWEIVELVGQEGACRLYRGYHRRLGISVAVKALPILARATADDGTEHTGDVQVRIPDDHPNLVKTIDTFATPQGDVYIVREWLEGRTLSSRLGEGRCLFDEARRIFDGICDGLSAAHRQGFVHRHLDSEKVFLALTPHGLVPKILDLDSVGHGLSEDRGLPDASLDVRAMGLLLYEMLSGTRPRVVGAEEDLLPSLLVAAPLLEVLRRAVSSERSLRPPSIEALRVEVHAAR